jgi:hypothetical protein
MFMLSIYIQYFFKYYDSDSAKIQIKQCNIYAMQRSLRATFATIAAHFVNVQYGLVTKYEVHK